MKKSDSNTPQSSKCIHKIDFQWNFYYFIDFFLINLISYLIKI